MYIYICIGLKCLSILSFCLHRWLQVFGNPLGCVQVPESVTDFDTNAVYDGYDETARCGDNCTELTVYVPSDGLCVQCPDGMRALGVGALNCSVLSPARCSLRARMHVYILVHACICVLSLAKCSLCAFAFVDNLNKYMQIICLHACMHLSFCI